MTMLLGILLALAGWSLSRTFEMSTSQAVLLDKVERLENSLQSRLLEEKKSEMADSDEKIIDNMKNYFKN